MDAIYVGIDVSKDRLDVHVRPSGEAFAVTRDGKGLEELVTRLQAISPSLIAVEATGGFETIVAAAPVCRWWWSIPPRSGTSPKRSASARRRIRSMRR